MDDCNFSGFNTSKNAYLKNSELKNTPQRTKLTQANFPSMTLERSNLISSQLNDTNDERKTSKAHVPKLLLTQAL